MAKVLIYASLTFKATSFGVVQLATHNVMMRIFYTHATIGDSLTAAAQTFLPSTFLQDTNENTKLLLKKLFVLGTGIGLLCFASTRTVLRMGHFFTSNTDIIAIMAKHTMSISLAGLLHGYIMILEGAIIAAGDFGYLVGTYILAMGALFYNLKFATPDFGALWFALLLFQCLRLIQFKSRVVQTVVLRPSSSKSGGGGQGEVVATS